MACLARTCRPSRASQKHACHLALLLLLVRSPSARLLDLFFTERNFHPWRLCSCLGRAFPPPRLSLLRSHPPCRILLLLFYLLMLRMFSPGSSHLFLPTRLYPQLLFTAYSSRLLSRMSPLILTDSEAAAARRLLFSLRRPQARSSSSSSHLLSWTPGSQTRCTMEQPLLTTSPLMLARPACVFLPLVPAPPTRARLLYPVLQQRLTWPRCQRTSTVDPDRRRYHRC